MAQAHLFDARSGNKSSLDLEGPRFGTEPNEHVIHRAVVAELDNRRRYTAHTKGRSDVTGSGAKLYRQKGTGRARVGAAYPHNRVGGGTWGGPKTKPPRFGKRINRKEARAAFDGALSATAVDAEAYGGAPRSPGRPAPPPGPSPPGPPMARSTSWTRSLSTGPPPSRPKSCSGTWRSKARC